MLNWKTPHRAARKVGGDNLSKRQDLNDLSCLFFVVKMNLSTASLIVVS